MLQQQATCDSHYDQILYFNYLQITSYYLGVLVTSDE